MDTLVSDGVFIASEISVASYLLNSGLSFSPGHPTEHESWVLSLKIMKSGLMYGELLWGSGCLDGFK